MAYKKGKITEVAPVQQEKEQQDTLIQTESEEKEMQEEADGGDALSRMMM